MFFPGFAITTASSPPKSKLSVIFLWDGTTSLFPAKAVVAFVKIRTSLGVFANSSPSSFTCAS